MLEQTIGARVKAYRQEAGLSQREVGRRSGINYTTIAQIEDNVNNSETVYALANIVGVFNKTLTDLFKGF
jgi:transcriptional regulator with XRE-family HTH domain